MKDELNSHEYNQERRRLLEFYQDESENLKLQKNISQELHFGWLQEVVKL